MKRLVKVLCPLLITATFIFGGVTTIMAQDNGRVTSADSTFINKNTADSTIELALAQLGEQKATDQEIKKAAAQVVADHNHILNELRRIGIKKNVIAANDNAPAAAKIALHPAIKGLENATGKEFEKLWLSQMLGMHEAKIAEIEMNAGQITDVELRSAVNRSLEKIKIHRDMLSRIKYKYQQ